MSDALLCSQCLGPRRVCCFPGAPGTAVPMPCFPLAWLHWEILTAHGLCLGLGGKTRLLQTGPVSEMGFAGAQGCGSWGAGSTSGLLSGWGAGKMPQEERDSCIFLSFL